MARRLEIDPAALDELKESAYHIDEQQPGLGEELTAAIEALVARLPERFETFAVARRSRGHEIRVALERRFKFRVVFVVRIRSIWVLSIARQSRRPFYWLSRLDDPPPD